MAALIDASILIEHKRGRLDLAQHLAHRQQEEFFLSVVTASELLHGVYRAVQPEIPSRRSAFVEAILERFPLLSVVWRPHGPMRRCGQSWQQPGR